MTSMSPPPTQQQGQQQGQQASPQLYRAQSGVPNQSTPPPAPPQGLQKGLPSQSAGQQQQPGLPQTGLQQQLQSLNQYYGAVRGASVQGLGGIGFDPYTQLLQQQGLQQPGSAGTAGGQAGSQLSIRGMAMNLAQRYGLSVGRGDIVDDQGNFLVTPDQLAKASGGQETVGTASAKMQMISQAITNQQNKSQQQKGIAAVSAGLGLVQSRGRGSLAAMQSGFYQDIADLYSNQEYEAADFSFFAEEERFRIQQELEARARKRAKKKARSGFVVGLIGAALAPFTGGATLGLAGGLASGGETGWF